MLQIAHNWWDVIFSSTIYCFLPILPVAWAMSYLLLFSTIIYKTDTTFPIQLPPIINHSQWSLNTFLPDDVKRKQNFWWFFKILSSFSFPIVNISYNLFKNFKTSFSELFYWKHCFLHIKIESPASILNHFNVHYTLFIYYFIFTFKA